MSRNTATSTTQKAQQFLESGYLIFDTNIPDTILDQTVKEFRKYWEGKKPIGVAHADAGRIQDGWVLSRGCFKIATFPNILNVLREIYGREPRPFQTLNFPVGTEQRPHADSIHFNCEPFGLMCGVWVALEDVGPDQGPLIYYPGSQTLPEMNYEDIGLVPDPQNYILYEDFIERRIAEHRFIPEYGIVKKGQAIVWAANLLHGGSARKNRTLTRQSQVTHYYFEGAKPWRPWASKNERVYFEPDWIVQENLPWRRRHLMKERIKAKMINLLKH
jgi:hypothetical protein